MRSWCATPGMRHAGHAPRGADVEPRAVARKERSILGRRRVEPRARLRVEAGSDDRPSGAVVAAGAILERVLEGPLWISDYTPPVDLISEWSAWTIWQMKGGTFDLNVFDGDEESFKKSLL